MAWRQLSLLRGATTSAFSPSVATSLSRVSQRHQAAAPGESSDAQHHTLSAVENRLHSLQFRTQLPQNNVTDLLERHIQKRQQLTDTQISGSTAGLLEFEAAFRQIREDRASNELRRQRFKESIALAITHDYTAAAKKLAEAADLGCVKASHNLAVMYAKGQHPAGKSPSDAAVHLTIASNRGCEASMVVLAGWYLRGATEFGIDANPKKGLKLMRRAALTGNADALFNLGVLHYKGEFVTHDSERACEFFRLAAERNHKAATRNYKQLKRQL